MALESGLLTCGKPPRKVDRAAGVPLVSKQGWEVCSRLAQGRRAYRSKITHLMSMEHRSHDLTQTDFKRPLTKFGKFPAPEIASP